MNETNYGIDQNALSTTTLRTNLLQHCRIKLPKKKKKNQETKSKIPQKNREYE